jgi:hypothetical protein
MAHFARMSIAAALSPSSDAPVIIRRHNNLRYLIWKISHLFSLLWIHSKIVYNLTKQLLGFLIRGSRVWSSSSSICDNLTFLLPLFFL